MRSKASARRRRPVRECLTSGGGRKGALASPPSRFLRSAPLAARSGPGSLRDAREDAAPDAGPPSYRYVEGRGRQKFMRTL
jgi:hypothetical protein